MSEPPDLEYARAHLSRLEPYASLGLSVEQGRSLYLLAADLLAEVGRLGERASYVASTRSDVFARWQEATRERNDLRGERDQLAAIVAHLRGLHRPVPGDKWAEHRCAVCIVGYDPRTGALATAAWPCETAVALYGPTPEAPAGPPSAPVAADQPPVGGIGATEAQRGAEGDFANDPAVLAWAREHVERDVAKLRQWEQKAADKGDVERALRWRRIANFLQREYVGGEGCVIAAFDKRRPALNARVRAENAVSGASERREGER